MRCEKAKELILTDYIDGEIDDSGRREVEDHIKSCAECRALLETSDGLCVKPFRASRKEAVPSYVWERVRREIARPPIRRPDLGADISESIGRAASSLRDILKPAIAFIAASAIIAAVMVARPMAQTRAADEYISEQMNFIISLDAAEPNGNGFFSTEIRVQDEGFV